MADSDTKENAKEVVKQVQEKAGQMGEQIKDQTSHFAGQAQTKVKNAIEEQKGKGIGELSGIAEAVRQTGQTLRDQEKDGIAHYAERTAEQIERVVQYLDSRDVTELLNEAEMFARRHPEAFLGGAFMLGLVAGRFLKSSRDHRMTDSRSDREEPMTVGSSPSSSI